MAYYVVPAQGPIYSYHNGSVQIAPHQLIKQIGLEFLQAMFQSSTHDTGYTWNPEPENAEILIVDKYSFNLDDVNVRPAIVGNRGPQRWGNTSGFQQRQEHDFRTARTIGTDLLMGSVVFNCFSREGIEAEQLAGFVFDWFRVFREPLRKNGLFRVESTSMGEEALIQADSRPDLSVVPVQVEASVQLRWSIQPRARVLQNIVASLGRITTPTGSFTL